MTAVEIFGVGGPVAGFVALGGFLVKAYLDRRQSRRDDTKSSRESESGIVETTKLALKLAREEMAEIDERRREERQEFEARIARLTGDNKQLRSQVAESRRKNE